MAKLKKTALGIIIGLLILTIFVTGFAGIKLAQINQGTVGIVQRPDATSTPLPERTLEPITGNIGDINNIDPTVDPNQVVQDPIYQQNPLNQSILNILLIGMDSSGTINTRSDSMILLSYNKEKGTIKMASFLRDTWINLTGRGWERLNAANVYGGPGLLINTLNDNFGLDIQYYISLHFNEFIKIVDKLGGVDVELSLNEIDYINNFPDRNFYGVFGNAGLKHLNGQQALAHCRNRSDGDFNRTRRQRDVITAIFNEMKHAKNDLGTLTDVVMFCLDNVKTNMEAGDLIDLGLDLLKQSLEIEQVQVPFGTLPEEGYWHLARVDGMSVIKIDLEANKQRLHEFLYPNENE